ncbi:MAG TPA: hydrolase [Prolixibacteraceae bacterium]|jgi:hydroxymethylpyrimidine pyrophosphatase-like HAD family hydrolase
MKFKPPFKQSLIIAIDFDGTIVEHRYPFIGRIYPFAFETMEALQIKGHRLILWSHRAGNKLEEAVKFCGSHGIEFYAVNKNFPEEVWDENDSRKILADIYIDDHNLGGLPPWGEIYNLICPEANINIIQQSKPWWKKVVSS